MPGLLSCVSGLLDLGAGEADTPKCQWPLHNQGGRKKPISQLKLNIVKEFSKFHAANQSDIKDTSYVRKLSQPTPGGLDGGVHPLRIFPKRSVSPQLISYEDVCRQSWLTFYFFLTLFGEWCIETA